MNKILNILHYAPKRTAITAMIAAAVIVPASLLAWGPSRATFTTASPAPYVTFNSITDNPAYGDERNFVQIQDENDSSIYSADNISLSANHTYQVTVYYHNNASSNLNSAEAGYVGVANGAYAKVDLPTGVTNNTTAKIVGYVGATNATPTQVWDDVEISNNTGKNLKISYVNGSATIHNSGATNGQGLSESDLFNGGSLLGYDALNGVLYGCNQYSGYVTFEINTSVETTYIHNDNQANFTISKQVHKTGVSGNWTESVTVNPGDSVDYLITYSNTGSTTQNNVVIKDILPTGVTYTAGTTYLTNSNYPNGLLVNDDVVTANGINIGNYAPSSTGYVKFSAKVANNDNLPTCGESILFNSAKAETDNGSKTDTAEVKVTKTCTTPTPTPTPTPEVLPKTGASENIAAIIGLGALVTSLGYYIASRRAI